MRHAMHTGVPGSLLCFFLPKFRSAIFLSFGHVVAFSFNL